MSTLTVNKLTSDAYRLPVKRKRLESIDLLRGIVMVIMALDHVRDYFHYDAFLYDPTDLSQTSALLFLTRLVTHYCAPVFIFLAGVSASLYGATKTKNELAYYLFTRGAWLVLVELFIISFALTFNPSYPIVTLQVIWAIGICMMVLSAMIYMKRQFILVVSILLIAGHNFLDTVHTGSKGPAAFLWSFLHEPRDFLIGKFTIFIHYPVIPWIGVMALGYYFGRFYDATYDPAKRRKVLFSAGSFAIVLFFILRISNIYGDAAHWAFQKSTLFTLLSWLNVTKYPPSLLYILLTLGPAMIFLSIAEKPLNAVTGKLTVFGRVPFFYYLVHIYLIHLLAIFGAMIAGYRWSDMIVSNRVSRAPELKGYGFNLLTVYLVWIGLVLLLYPCCKWFDRYKRMNQSKKRWLTYL